jgi:hypothetical protein
MEVNTIHHSIVFLLMFTVLLTEFSVLIIFIQFFRIDLFTMSNSAIQLDLNFNFSRINLLDKVFVESKISLTYIKSLLQMIDIKRYFIALKASWLSRLVTGHILIGSIYH